MNPVNIPGQFESEKVSFQIMSDFMKPDFHSDTNLDLNLNAINSAAKFFSVNSKPGKRCRVSSACQPCKSSRTKCSDARPCSRCIGHGRPESCTPDESNKPSIPLKGLEDGEVRLRNLSRFHSILDLLSWMPKICASTQIQAMLHFI